MKHFYSFILIGLFILSAKAQFKSTALTIDISRTNHNTIINNSRTASANGSDTITIPFLDDFSTSNITPDTALWLNEGGVYINNHYAITPPTKNVASFDGIQSDGFPYVFPVSGTGTESVNGLADYLTSKPIDISNYTPADSLGFSFFWQKGGIHPDLNPELSQGDSLLLSFFNKKDSTWVRIWPLASDTISIINYNSDSGFSYIFIPITDSAYFSDAFQFKFQSIGKLTGNWDLWSIDYVYLDTGRVTENVQDFGFGATPTSLLKDYHAMPYTQFSTNPSSFLANTITSNYSNLSISENFRDDKFFWLYEISDSVPSKIDSLKEPSGLPAGGTIGAQSTTTISWTIDKQTIIDSLAVKIQSEFALQYTVQLRGADQIELLKSNDTISNTTYIANYYAYDDGTTEGAAGFSGYGKLAYQFELFTPDTLTEIFIHWAKVGFNVEQTSITVQVWQALGGIDNPTDIELISTPTIVVYEDNFNEFTSIPLSSKLPMTAGTFYVGWEQNTSNELKVGVDLSSDHRDKLYEFNSGTWKGIESTSFQGTPMIRPKFGDKKAIGLDPVGIQETIKKEYTVQAFPNPADDVIKLKGIISYYRLYDLTGKVVRSATFDEAQLASEIDTNLLPDGLYILEAGHQKSTSTQRVNILH